MPSKRHARTPADAVCALILGTKLEALTGHGLAVLVDACDALDLDATGRARVLRLIGRLISHDDRLTHSFADLAATSSADDSAANPGRATLTGANHDDRSSKAEEAVTRRLNQFGKIHTRRN